MPPMEYSTNGGTPLAIQKVFFQSMVRRSVCSPIGSAIAVIVFSPYETVLADPAPAWLAARPVSLLHPSGGRPRAIGRPAVGPRTSFSQKRKPPGLTARAKATSIGDRIAGERGAPVGRKILAHPTLQVSRSAVRWVEGKSRLISPVPFYPTKPNSVVPLHRLLAAYQPFGNEGNECSNAQC